MLPLEYNYGGQGALLKSDSVESLENKNGTETVKLTGSILVQSDDGA